MHTHTRAHQLSLDNLHFVYLVPFLFRTIISIAYCMENNVEYIFVPKRLRSRLQHGKIFKIAWNYHHFERTKLMQPLKLNEVTLIATNFIVQNNVND